MQDLIDRYPQLDHCDREALALSTPIAIALDDASSNLNNLQLATTMLAFKNMEKKKHQMWVVGAGQGKSRVHVALTFAILTHAR